jgi:hypothetical protein
LDVPPMGFDWKEFPGVLPAHPFVVSNLESVL